jgi:HicB-like protein involved in pilus formation
MSRLTLRLPETLHRQLEAQAKREGVSLNQYVVYALSRQLTQSYTVHAVPEEKVAQQQAQFTTLLRELGQASPEAIRAVLAARDHVASEHELTPDAVARLRARMAAATSKAPPAG